MRTTSVSNMIRGPIRRMGSYGDFSRKFLLIKCYNANVTKIGGFLLLVTVAHTRKWE